MQRSYRRNYAPAVAGQLSGLGVPRVRSYKNVIDTTIAQSNYDTWQINISPNPGTPNTTYFLTVNGITVSAPYTAGMNQELFDQVWLNAIRKSEIYDLAVPTIFYNPEIASQTYLVLTARASLTPLKVTGKPGSFSSGILQVPTYWPSTDIPYGRVVGRYESDTPDTAHLMRYLFETPVGITLATRANERQGIGQSATSAYAFGDVMDVVDAVNANEGIWVECVEYSGISEDDTVYVSVDDNHLGKVTKQSSDTLVLPYSSFKSNVCFGINGQPIILVSINFP